MGDRGVLRLLFVKESQNWPRASGHDVHGFNMMKAMAARGHAISLAIIVPPTRAALAGLPLAGTYSLAGQFGDRCKLPLSRWEKRFARYYGISAEWGTALSAILRAHRFDAVVVVARHLLPLLAVVRGPVRIWYPADDPAWHHLSRIWIRDPSTWSELRPAAINALYERAFRGHFDRIWVVSPADRTATRFVSGCRQVDLIPNGVDGDYYHPMDRSDLPNSCAFWGRLDFGPNVDAIAWFLREVWPTVRAETPSARFSVFGFNPTHEVRVLAQVSGVELHPDLPDLRAEVARRQAVVLPFVSGGGIKNKLLEAAALGMPIVCSRRALSGARGRPAVRVAAAARDWSAALASLWKDADARRALGEAARRWVLTHHTWDAAAQTAEAGIMRSADRRGG